LNSIAVFSERVAPDFVTIKTYANGTVQWLMIKVNYLSVTNHSNLINPNITQHASTTYPMLIGGRKGGLKLALVIQGTQGNSVTEQLCAPTIEGRI
jgi:hypothetical protein